MVANQLKQRRFVQVCEDLAQFFVVVTASCKLTAVTAPQPADWRVAILAANLAGCVTIAAAKSHWDHLQQCAGPGHRGAEGLGCDEPGPWRGRCRPAVLITELCLSRSQVPMCT